MRVLKTRTYEKPYICKKGQLVTVTYYQNRILQHTLKKDMVIDTCTIFSFNKKDELFGFKKGLGVILGEKDENTASG